MGDQLVVQILDDDLVEPPGRGVGFVSSGQSRGLGAVLDDCVAQVGAERLGSLHLNDSQTPLGSNRDRHANIGQGELGDDGCAAFLSEPRFEGLPATLETPGPEKKGTSKAEVTAAKRLRREGLKRREK